MSPSLSRRSAETRFQGIATSRTEAWGDMTPTRRSAETRFQGIATGNDPRPPRIGMPRRSAETRFQGIATNFRTPIILPAASVGVPRPVFRGLRPVSSASSPLLSYKGRSAETRFQGIATRLSSCLPFSSISGRSAETRFQGIATNAPKPRSINAPPYCRSAETRFQGIATMASGTSSTYRASASECRDPFSGDCDLDISCFRPVKLWVGVPRPVFRGLRRGFHSPSANSATT